MHPLLAGPRHKAVQCQLSVKLHFQLVSTSINSVSSWLPLPSDKSHLVTLESSACPELPCVAEVFIFDFWASLWNHLWVRAGHCQPELGLFLRFLLLRGRAAGDEVEKLRAKYERQIEAMLEEAKVLRITAGAAHLCPSGLLGAVLRVVTLQEKWLLGCLWCRSQIRAHNKLSEVEKHLDLSQYIFLFTLHQSSSSSRNPWNSRQTWVWTSQVFLSLLTWSHKIFAVRAYGTGKEGQKGSGLSLACLLPVAC